MHIAVLSDPNHFHTQKWVKALLRAGVKVSVFSFMEGKIEGANCIQIKPRFTPKGRISYLSYLFSARRLARALRAHQIDVLNPIHVTPYGVWGERTGFQPMVNVSMGADILEFPLLSAILIFR